MGKYTNTAPWLYLHNAIRRAANIELTSWKTEHDFMHHFKVTRHSLGGEWKQFNIDKLELTRIPLYEIERIVDDMIEQLFQPIIDLPWEDYLCPEEPPTFFYEFKLGRIMTVDEYKALEGLERIIDASGTTRTSREGEGPTRAG